MISENEAAEAGPMLDDILRRIRRIIAEDERSRGETVSEEDLADLPAGPSWTPSA